MKNNLEIAKKIIEENYSDAEYGIFDTHNIIGEITYNIYYENELIIDICYDLGYFEVFGLSDEEFKELEEYYNSLD